MELAEDEALEGGSWVGGDLRDVEMLVALFFVKPVLDPVVGVNGECDVEEVDCAREVGVCPSDAVNFHVRFQVVEVVCWGRAECRVGVPEREAVVDEAIRVDESWVGGRGEVSFFVVGVIDIRV